MIIDMDIYLERKINGEQFHLHLDTNDGAEIDKVLDEINITDCIFIDENDFNETVDMTKVLLGASDDMQKDVGYLIH